MKTTYLFDKIKPAVNLGFFSLLFLMLLGGSSLAQKQQKCGDLEIFNARQLYERGRFQETVDQLKACQKRKFEKKEQRIEAHRWLALSYIALDYPELAEVEIFALVKLDHFYRPESTDPELFKTLVAQERKKYREQRRSIFRNWRFLAIGGAVLTTGAILGVTTLSPGDDGGGTKSSLPDPPVLP